MAGWGSGSWGGSAWGSGSDGLRLVAARAIRTNLVRLAFNEAPKFTRLLDAGDASAIERFAFAPIAGTKGFDGLAPRAVAPAKAEIALVAGAGGSQIDVWLDRPMSPYPAGYLASVNSLVAASGGAPLEIGSTSAEFLGLAGALPKNVPDLASGKRDLAQPDEIIAALGIIGGADQIGLGGLPIDALGDYGSDEGLASYKKRIFRRLTTRRDGFKHLDGYGVGTLDPVKTIGSPAIRAQLASEAETQVKLEPETISCRATLALNAGLGVWFLSVAAIARGLGSAPVGISAAFAPTG